MELIQLSLSCSSCHSLLSAGHWKCWSILGCQIVFVYGTGAISEDVIISFLIFVTVADFLLIRFYIAYHECFTFPFLSSASTSCGYNRRLLSQRTRVSASFLGSIFKRNFCRVDKGAWKKTHLASEYFQVAELNILLLRVFVCSLERPLSNSACVHGLITKCPFLPRLGHVNYNLWSALSDGVGNTPRGPIGSCQGRLPNRYGHRIVESLSRVWICCHAFQWIPSTTLFPTW